MKHKLLVALFVALALWCGYWLGRETTPPKVVQVAVYRYVPMPTDCEKCEKL